MGLVAIGRNKTGPSFYYTKKTAGRIQKYFFPDLMLPQIFSGKTSSELQNVIGLINEEVLKMI